MLTNKPWALLQDRFIVFFEGQLSKEELVALIDIVKSACWFP